MPIIAYIPGSDNLYFIDLYENSRLSPVFSSTYTIIFPLCWAGRRGRRRRTKKEEPRGSSFALSQNISVPVHQQLRRRAVAGKPLHRQGAGVGAGVGQRVQIDGRDGAVVHSAKLNGHLHLVARVARGDSLLTGVAAVARTAGLLGHERNEDLAAARLLGAKAATDARLNDLHLRLRNIERLRDHAAHVEGHLRGGGHRDAAERVGRREGAEGLHGRGLRGLRARERARPARRVLHDRHQHLPVLLISSGKTL